MAIMEWGPALSVNVKQFDDQHKNLVAMVNQLHDAMKVGKGKEIIGEISAALLDYTKRHFSAEETLMKLHNYPGYEEQKKVHNQLVSQILDIQKKFDAGTVISQEVITFLKNWLVNHIQGMDQKYGSYLNLKGVH